MTTRKDLFLIYEIQNTPNIHLRKVAKFQDDVVCCFTAHFGFSNTERAVLGQQNTNKIRHTFLGSGKNNGLLSLTNTLVVSTW